MTRTTIIAALLAVLATEALAQLRQFYKNSSGKRIGSAITDSRGARRITTREAR